MLDSTEIINRIRLLGTDNIGAISFYKLLGRYHSASQALEHLPPQYVPPSFGQAEQSFSQAQKQGITLLHFDSPTYPKNLKQLRDAPPLLYVLGNPDLLNASPAVSFGYALSAVVFILMAIKESKERPLSWAPVSEEEN